MMKGGFKVVGDGVLAEFASDFIAVQCAVDLQQRMAAANAGPDPGTGSWLRLYTPASTLLSLLENM
jgi:class 3 adenylate cyclase